MITGIDEVGDFDPNSKYFNYFVSVSIDQNGNKYELKKKQFDEWEQVVPASMRTQNGEVKGQLLSDEQLESFYTQVIETKPSVLFSVVRIIPLENTTDILEKHKKIEIDQILGVIEKAKANDHKSWVDAYEKICAWYKNRNYQQLMKMKCMETILGISFNHLFGYAQLRVILDMGDTKNLSNIQFKIDKDFIRADNVKIIWNEILRQFWRSFVHKNPIPVIAGWPGQEHPVDKIFNDSKGIMNVKKVFTKNVSFLDSNNSWEIRMADIVGTIIHRFQNYGRCEKIYQKISNHIGGKKKNYRHLYLGNA